MARRISGLAGCAVATSILLAAPSHAQEADAAAVEQRFALLHFQVDGNTKLSIVQIETAVYPFLGPDRSFADLDGARAALESAYHDAGFLTVFVDVPRQQLVNGRVRLKVTEGRLANVTVTGAKHRSDTAVLADVPELREGNVPNFNRMQAELGTVNATPDLQAAPVLRPGAEPGTVDAELKVTDSLPVHGSVEVNNRYTTNTSHARLSVAGQYTDLWQRRHSLELDATTAPADVEETTVLRAGYKMPAGDGRLAFYVLHSNSDVVASGDVNLTGSGDVLGMRWQTPGLFRGAWYQFLSTGIDMKDIEETISLDDDSGFETPIRYYPLQVQWNGIRLEPGGGADSSSFSLTANYALRGFGADDADFDEKRFEARADYWYLQASGRTFISLTERSQLGLRALAQFANQPLVSGEQFAAGGADSVRGYTEAERIGDRGVNLSAEWLFPGLFTSQLLTTEVDALAFIDWATLRTLEPLPDQDARFDLASVGVGFRIRLMRSFNAAIDIAQQLREDVDENKSVRVHGSVNYSF